MHLSPTQRRHSTTATNRRPAEKTRDCLEVGGGRGLGIGSGDVAWETIMRGVHAPERALGKCQSIECEIVTV